MMNMDISVSNLLIDSNNPRLAETINSQNDLIRAIAQNQNKKLARLAADIVENGVNPTELLLVMSADTSSNLYIVLEGNRRIAAIKILEEPEIIHGAVDKTTYEQIKKISKNYHEKPILSLKCVVFDTRDDANHWIELKHTGQNEGAGIVQWGAAETERFRKRSGQKPPHLQILDFLEERKYIDNNTKKATPITSLKRLISTPYIREKLGIEVHSGQVHTKLSSDEFGKGLKKIVEDLATQTIRTGDIYHTEDRIKYINSINPDLLPDLSLKTTESLPIEKTTKSPISKSLPSPRDIPSSQKRKSLVPSRGFHLKINQARINNIYNELKTLDIFQYTNAISVLFRVFLELSVDDYIEKNNLGTDIRSKLKIKLEQVGEHLLNVGKINEQQLKPVRRAAESNSFFGPSVTSMHQYIHNQYFHPAPQDLIANWDSLEPFIQAIWS